MKYEQYSKWLWVFVAIFSILIFILIVNRLTSNYPVNFPIRNALEYPFKSGDLLLESSHDQIISFFGDSFFTHTCILYQCPTTMQFYVWEIRFPRMNIVNAIAGSKIRFGTRLTPLWRHLERKKKYTICVRSINKPVDQKKFDQFILENRNRYFSLDFVSRGLSRFFGSWTADMNLHRPVDRPANERYCAELTAETYCHLGVFRDSGIAYTPCDFSKRTEHLSLANGYSFGPEIKLELPKKISLQIEL